MFDRQPSHFYFTFNKKKPKTSVIDSLNADVTSFVLSGTAVALDVGRDVFGSNAGKASFGGGWLMVSNLYDNVWAHYLLWSFYLASRLIVLMVVVSLLTKAPVQQDMMPSGNEIYVEIG